MKKVGGVKSSKQRAPPWTQSRCAKRTRAHVGQRASGVTVGPTRPRRRAVGSRPQSGSIAVMETDLYQGVHVLPNRLQNTMRAPWWHPPLASHILTISHSHSLAAPLSLESLAACSPPMHQRSKSRSSPSPHTSPHTSPHASSSRLSARLSSRPRVAKLLVRREPRLAATALEPRPRLRRRRRRRPL